MNKLTVLELFSGIGAFSKGLKNANIPFKIVGFSDIEESAIDAFSLIHNISKDLSLGDIRQVNGKQFKGVDLITHGSPCQDLTRGGKNKGADENSYTRSSLMWETVRIVEESMPKYVVWEQVPDVKSKRHIHNFNKYIKRLNELGYNSYDKVLYAYDFGSAQKRRRLFTISIRKDVDKGDFQFPTGNEMPKQLKDYLEERIDDTYLVEEKVIAARIIEKLDINKYKVQNNTKLGYLIAEEFDGIDFGFYSSKARRGRVQKQSTQTLLTGKSIGTLINDKFYYLTPKEYWLLQEFDEEDFKKAKQLGLSDNKLYLLAGNSINVKVTTALFKELFKNKNIK